MAFALKFVAEGIAIFWGVFPVLGAQDSQDKAKGLYAAVQFGAPDAEVSFNETSFEANGDISNSTYSFLDVNLECRTLGSIQSGQLAIADGEAYFLNLVPEYVISNSYADYYLALTLGVGEMQLDYNIHDVIDVTTQSEFTSEIGLEYGIIYY